MKIGDLVIRKIVSEDGGILRSLAAKKNREELGHGIILSKQMGGSNPVHPCITVLYSKIGRVYDIAESLVEVISEAKELTDEELECVIGGQTREKFEEWWVDMVNERRSLLNSKKSM